MGLMGGAGGGGWCWRAGWVVAVGGGVEGGGGCEEVGWCCGWRVCWAGREEWGGGEWGVWGWRRAVVDSEGEVVGEIRGGVGCRAGAGGGCGRGGGAEGVWEVEVWGEGGGWCCVGGGGGVGGGWIGWGLPGGDGRVRLLRDGCVGGGMGGGNWVWVCGVSVGVWVGGGCLRVWTRRGVWWYGGGREVEWAAVGVGGGGGRPRSGACGLGGGLGFSGRGAVGKCGVVAGVGEVSPALRKVESFRVHKVTGDGRCMFRALVKGMDLNKSVTLSAREERENADELRMAIKEVLCDNHKESISTKKH
ncbi:OTU domain-containing protein [Tanacetum coccineum]|uniref:OTU domain-containing protein n=1 Tax=Tanacetum coccineum TaxID=301880 RepID=A0ABQ4YXV0_9ASTR